MIATTFPHDPFNRDVMESFYVPQFIWRFWLDACPVDLSNYSHCDVTPSQGLHVYDSYQNMLKTGYNECPFAQGVFDQIERYIPEITKHRAWAEANEAFQVLEKDAETAIHSLLHQVESKTRSNQPYGLAAAKQTWRPESMRVTLGRHSLHSLQKYLMFLRFRNRETFGNFLQRVSKRRKSSVQLQENDTIDPLRNWADLLQGFSAFFKGGTGASGDTEAFNFICECIHLRYSDIESAELCIGLAPEPDEYILSASCFGVLEEDGTSKVMDDPAYFFPITPRFALYLLVEVSSSLDKDAGQQRPHFLRQVSQTQETIDHDLESSIDVYQRNALLLQTLPQFIIFASARSMMRSVRYYNDRRWLPENLDYSKLLRGCLEESVTHTLLVKASIEVIDLTDDVTRIGDFAVCHGGFADVWKGLWTDRQSGGLPQLVALKVLRANMVNFVQERLLSRLKKEVQAWHRLDHPHVAKLYGVMQLPQTLAMVSPWCDNGTVVKYLRETKPDANRLQLLYEVASGVSYLHGRSPVIVHGDLKGGNILIDANGRAVITDFGLARVKEEVSEITGDQHTSLFAGSTRWMAPELVLAQVEDDSTKRMPLSTKSDVYAFASVCLEVLTGHVPYPHRKNDHAVTIDVMRGIKPSRGTTCLVDVEKTSSLWAIMDLCWDENPLARPNMPRLRDCIDTLRLK
ncbi:kinase-like protein [Schizopora paradoxa]|uniref:Kinase-like protein n=1 Tax=Schizopora paradoxa TaxID=27342 RepID=A0A0H2R7R2_9AGAM|nr:kinase-like protein [Schizopora paradoxa]